MLDRMFNRLVLIVISACLATIAALAAFGAAVVLCIAFYLWLATLLAPPAAAAITGGVLVVFALIAVLAAWLCLRPRKPRPGPAREPAQAAARLGMAAGEAVLSSTRSRPFAVLLVAVAAGFVAGMRPELLECLCGALNIEVPKQADRGTGGGKT